MASGTKHGRLQWHTLRPKSTNICHLLSVIWKFVFHSGTYRERYTYLAGGDSYSELFLWARKRRIQEYEIFIVLYPEEIRL